MKLVSFVCNRGIVRPLCGVNNFPSNFFLRHASDAIDVNFLENTDLSAIKAGRGGRSSWSGRTVTVFGANGLFGKALIQKLANCGTQCLLPHRQYDTIQMRDFRVMGDLGQILFTRLELFDDNSLRKCMQHSDVVVNLIGCKYEFQKGNMEKVNVDAARRIARIAKEMGVRHFIHFSALNSNIKHKGYLRKGGSLFYETKGKGEHAVLCEYPNATIIRPSEMFGVGDSFLYSLTHVQRTQYLFHKVFLPHKGVGVFKQPVYVHDVARAVVNMVLEPYKHDGIIYEAVGPRRYEMKDIMRQVLEIARMSHEILDANSLYFRLKTAIIELEPLGMTDPGNDFNRDMLEREATTDITCGHPTLKDAGITNLTTLDDVILREIHGNRRNLTETEGTMDVMRYPPIKHVECPEA